MPFSLTITPGGDPVTQLVDHIVILSMETQKAFAEVYGGFDWRVDLTEPAVFWFETEPRTIFQPRFIGSTSGISNTWLWGWENINGFPDDVVATAISVRDIGAHLEATELTTAKLDLGAAERAAAGLSSRDNADYDYVLAALALAPIQAPVYYRGPTGEGSYAWFLIDNDEAFTLAAPTPLTTVSAIMDAVSSGMVGNGRLAIEKYAERRGGIALAEGDGGVDLVMDAGKVHVDFDDQGRIAGVAAEANAPGAQSADTKGTRPGFLGRLFGKNSS